MSHKKTLVIGASANPERYSYLATERLTKYGHPVIALGNKAGNIRGTEIKTVPEAFEGIDTVTLYLSPAHQQAYYDYIISLHPNRVIFNPGTENETFAELLQANHIPSMEACTLVLLSTGQY